MYAYVRVGIYKQGTECGSNSKFKKFPGHVAEALSSHRGASVYSRPCAKTTCSPTPSSAMATVIDHFTYRMHNRSKN